VKHPNSLTPIPASLIAPATAKAGISAGSYSAFSLYGTLAFGVAVTVCLYWTGLEMLVGRN
jgi:hypothetical protein